MKVVKFFTPCGFQIWLIHVDSLATLNIRVFWEGEEQSLDRLKCKLSPAGALMLATNINKMYEEHNGTKQTLPAI